MADERPLAQEIEERSGVFRPGVIVWTMIFTKQTLEQQNIDWGTWRLRELKRPSRNGPQGAEVLGKHVTHG